VQASGASDLVESLHRFMSRFAAAVLSAMLLSSCRALPLIPCLRRLATRCHLTDAFPWFVAGRAPHNTNPSALSRHRPCGSWPLK
jgi:hypothetical protein